MAKFKSKNGETMTWLPKNEVMISFIDGIATVNDTKLVRELVSLKYVNLDQPNTSTTKTK